MNSSDVSVVGAYGAQIHLSELLERVARGEEIIITRRGAPIARLVPNRPTPLPVPVEVRPEPKAAVRTRHQLCAAAAS
jgi:prevent-host-death family protein